MKKRTLPSIVFLWVLPTLAMAHGGTPRIVQISFPPQLAGDFWAVTDNQGLYASTGGSYNWLCEDSVVRNAGFQQAVLVGEDTAHWLVSTNFGLFRSDDGGCNFEPCEGPVTTHVPTGLWPHPSRPGEVVTATQTPGVPNDVFWSADGGRTWTAAGLAFDGITHNMLRPDVAPDRVYVAHARGAARSDDGGRTFTDITLGPPALDVVPEEFRLLGAHPTRPDEVWATIERFPDSTVMRSQDAGATWTPMFTLADTPGGFVFDETAGRALVVSRFDEYRRSDDGGETWTRVPETVPLLGCLTMQPETNRLWGCSNVFFMGPWVLGYSDDFGDTWTPALARFTDVRSQWGCAADAESTLACEGLCPGQAAGAMCDLGADAGVPGADAAPVSFDLGALRLDASGGDAGPPDPAADDAALSDDDDARVTAAQSKNAGGGGCTSVRGVVRPQGAWLAFLAALALSARGRRRMHR